MNDIDVTVGTHWIVVCRGWKDTIYYGDGGQTEHVCGHQEVKGPGRASGAPVPGPALGEGG